MRVKVYRDKSAKKEWRWTIYAGNNRAMANGGEGYNNRMDALNGLRRITGSDFVFAPDSGPGDYPIALGFQTEQWPITYEDAWKEKDDVEQGRLPSGPE